MFLTLAAGVAHVGALWFVEERCRHHRRKRRELCLLMEILYFKLREHGTSEGNEHAGKICGTQRGMKFLSREGK